MAKGPGVLVLCTGNSARSQMAEAFLGKHGGGRFPVYSAGTEPAREIHPMTRRVLAEVGLEPDPDKRPQGYEELLGRLPVHTIIVVCDGANEACPRVWPGARERLFWPFEDPAAAPGDEAQRLAVFRRVRDAIEERVIAWLGDGPGAPGSR